MIPVFPDTKVALKGKKGLIVGVANDQSIAWGCARAFRGLGAELAYRNDGAGENLCAPHARSRGRKRANPEVRSSVEEHGSGNRSTGGGRTDGMNVRRPGKGRP